MAAAASGLAAAGPQTPQQQLGPLYDAVEAARIFADDKDFADAVPNEPPADILALYNRESPLPPLTLKRFVEAHFQLPQTTLPAQPPAGLSLDAHIDALWPLLVRNSPDAPRDGSLLPLPHPYVVPGGRFREMYYWDSYFTMLGLAQSGRRDLVNDMVEDFAHLIDTYGHVPNGNRSYYLSRSQPPFFFAMVALLDVNDPAAAYARYLPELKREYAFWMRGNDRLTPGSGAARVVALPDGAILNRYWDDSDLPRDESYRIDRALAASVSRPPSELYRDVRAAAESGWDFSSRWFADGRTLQRIDTTAILPVDLNSLLYGLELAIAQGCGKIGDRSCVQDFRRHATDRRAAIDHYLWNANSGVYFDYDWKRKRATGILSAAGLYPLFFGAASQPQADRVAETTKRSLLKPGGIVTTTTNTGQQWDAPNGWAPLQWIAVSGLNRYGHKRLAEAVACRWLVNVQNVYRQSGKLMEKYDVETLGRSGGGGEYAAQDGFGWTNGVTKIMIAKYRSALGLSSANQCPIP